MNRAWLAVGWVCGLGWVCVLAACEHSQPFGMPSAEPNVPFSSAFPRRLTFNPGADVAPAWLPDGSGIIYSYEVPQPDSDQCLGIMPAEGGHLSWSTCPQCSPVAADSTRVLTEPTVGPAGVLAYLRGSKQVGARTFSSMELVVATLGNAAPGRVVRTVPYTAPDSQLHVAVAYLRWLDAQSLVWVAQVYVYPDTYGSEIVRLDVSTAPATVTVVPGTGAASSLAVDGDSALYYTVGGDSHVYRYMAGAAPDTVFDLGPAGAPVGIQVRGDILVADVNGAIYRVDLRLRSVTPIPSPGSMLASNPALSPSATRLVVQTSSGASSGDLWLLRVP